MGLGCDEEAARLHRRDGSLRRGAGLNSAGFERARSRGSVSASSRARKRRTKDARGKVWKALRRATEATRHKARGTHIDGKRQVVFARGLLLPHAHADRVLRAGGLRRRERALKQLHALAVGGVAADEAVAVGVLVARRRGPAGPEWVRRPPRSVQGPVGCAGPSARIWNTGR